MNNHNEHDEELDPMNCEECREYIKQSALDAGIPLSVFEGKTKLSDHFSSEYIESMAYPKGREYENK